jgi:hypothetical protein
MIGFTYVTQINTFVMLVKIEDYSNVILKHFKHWILIHLSVVLFSITRNLLKPHLLQIGHSLFLCRDYSPFLWMGV